MSQTSITNIPTHLSLVALSVIAINSVIISPNVQAETIRLESIVITGEKIDKSIKDTTTAVTVINEDELEKGESNNALDIATHAPNVIADSFDHIAIRGISGGGAANGGLVYLTSARARIATVIDGTTQDWSGYNFSPSSLWDTKQVEVLRGPQSTTQGSSAIAGAIVVNTNDPTFDSEAAVRIGLETYKNGNLKYNLAAMSSGAIIDEELAYRIAIDKTQGEGFLNYETSSYDTPNPSESESFNVRGKLLWEASSIPELSTKVTINYHKNDGEHANFASNTEEGMETQTYTLNGTNEFRIQDSNANSFAVDIDYEFDQGITNAFHISQSSSDIHDDAYSTGYEYDINQDTTALENRVLFNRKDSNLSGVLGLFISEKDASLSTDNYDIQTAYTTATTAAYGESMYSLSSKAKIALGLRIENENTDKTSSTQFSGSGNNEQSTDETHYLPKLGVTYAASNSTTIGATIRQGYSPSGAAINFSGVAYTYDSEEVTSFELSSKSHFNNGTTLNANVFYNDYTDYQAGTSSFTIVNVDAATTYGMELEATKWLTENLELRGSIGLLKSEIDEDDSYKGNELTSAPESSLSIGFTQYIDTTWSFGADITHVGEYYSDLDNTSSSISGDYVMADARIQYMMGNLTINGYIKNLTDEDAVYYRGGVLAAVGQTRTIGINATYRM
ncbi:TonB-dependent receptor [Marinomonas colpomeniae]|uniref:TonB-dependent receptor n=1 Tax=Marinomonas colpomeniae TaxID=2774408 RepID=A0ABR8NXQ1_9GAMM|nr:TonB-dependent receptor [Marinomonas colpomeniae]MBD5770796.1 TonB-dependent receptor [Marinomonas colpomeniae]